MVGGIIYQDSLLDAGTSREEQLEMQLRVKQWENETLRQELDKAKTRIKELNKQVNESKTLVSRSTKRPGWHQVDGVITAYSPLDDANGINSEGNPNITSIGEKVGRGKFAVDPERIPYGSEILIVYEDGSVEKGIAADTGGALRNAPHIAIDVYRETFQDAMKFGKRSATVLWKKETPNG